MIDMAARMTKDMLNNAASWDNFSEDPKFTPKDWSDFSSMSGGGGAGGNDEVVDVPPTPKPTEANAVTPEPTKKPAQKVTYTVRSSINGGKCVGNSKSLTDVNGGSSAWIDCARQVLND